jgi:serine/threonine-protein kinase
MLEPLGEGTSSIVFRASRRPDGAEVALKVFPRAALEADDFVQRFERELTVSASLDHPGIARLYEWGRDAEGAWIAMELVEGVPLRHLIAPPGLALDRALPVLRGVLEAVAHAHDKGVVHRDIKPENIMITPAGQPKIIDFGIALGQTTNTLTETGVVYGTFRYMPAERLAELRDDPRSDQYSIGVTAFEMLAGRQPFLEPPPAVVTFQHVYRDPPSLRALRPDVAPELEILILRMMAKNYVNRFSSLHEALDVLRPLLQSSPQ